MLIQFFLFLFFHFCQSKNTPPVIIEQPQDLIAELDKPMAIHCRAESSSLDDLQIDWYKDGRLVTTDPNARIITEFMALHVINTMPQDAGVYHCIAKNSYGQTQSRKARIQFLKLDREFVISPMSTSASIGEHIRLRCQPPHGSPSPTVYWTKDGKNVSIPLDHHDLVFSSIEKSDFGLYRCLASNGLLRQSSPAYLTEFHRPKISLQPSTSRIDLRRGQSVHFECHIDNDEYELEWHFQDKIFPNHTIDIPSIEFDQSGLYTCIGRLDKYSFNEQILIAVHDREDEKVFSQSNLTVFLGQSALIDCQLPFHPEKNISWTILNQSTIDQIQFDSVDTNQYRLKIARIKDFHNNVVLQCSYQNQSSQGLVQLNLQRVQPPPIISYIPNNQTVPIGVEVRFPCQSNDQMNIQWTFTPTNRPYKIIKIDNNRKYRIDPNHDLIIRHVEKTDGGIYKCRTMNKNHDETTWIAHLSVEDARSNAVFHRVERNDLPQAPSQPKAMTITSHSIELSWNIPSANILDYLIEYYEINSNHENLYWERFLTKNHNSRQIITNLKMNSVYQFIIRARNSFGYGLPSIISDLIETKNNSQFDKEFLYLYEPINIQETSITIKWNSLQNKPLSVYIINEKNTNERIETIRNSSTTYTINNLQPYTDYSIRLIYSLDIKGRASNTISVRTLESLPSSSPTHVIVQLTSKTSLSIQWDPPLENETNGKILAYKVHCLSSNETNSIRLINISSDTKGLFIKNLLENMEYCISIAARTQIGYGPYSPPICVTMNDKFLLINRNGFRYHLHAAISQPWFLPVIIISSIVFTCAFSYALWLCFHYLTQQHHHHHRIKFNSSASSSNQSVELPVQKTLSNGKRYDLIKDTPPPPPIPSSTALWMNSIPNSIRLQCCTTTTTGSAGSHNEHNAMNIHKNPINELLHESRQAQQLNPYATTGIFQQSTSPSLPTYSETVHSLHRQQQPPPQITSIPLAQYQPPWLDHYSSSTLQYRSQSNTPHHCIHCTSQSHPHTPSSIRTTLRSPSTHRQNNNTKNSTIENIQLKMNSSPLVKLQSSNPIMINSLGGETMTTSWASSTDDHHAESISSSSSTDKNIHGNKQAQSSSEGSLFSDSDIQLQKQQEEEVSNTSALVQFERGPSFLMANE